MDAPAPSPQGGLTPPMANPGGMPPPAANPGGVPQGGQQPAMPNPGGMPQGGQAPQGGGIYPPAQPPQTPPVPEPAVQNTGGLPPLPATNTPQQPPENIQQKINPYVEQYGFAESEASQIETAMQALSSMENRAQMLSYINDMVSGNFQSPLEALRMSNTIRNQVMSQYGIDFSKIDQDVASGNITPEQASQAKQSLLQNAEQNASTQRQRAEQMQQQQQSAIMQHTARNILAQTNGYAGEVQSWVQSNYPAAVAESINSEHSQLLINAYNAGHVITPEYAQKMMQKLVQPSQPATAANPQQQQQQQLNTEIQRAMHGVDYAKAAADMDARIKQLNSAH